MPSETPASPRTRPTAESRIMKLAQILVPSEIRATAIMESVALPILAIGIGIWFNPTDPLWIQSAFPWPWLSPVILALRYGPFSGLCGALVLLVGWIALSPLSFKQGSFPELYFLGGLILTMLCGEFSSIWRARVRRAEAMQLYLDQRLEYLTYQHYLLRLSHDRLEQDLIVRPVAMRDALVALRNLSTTIRTDIPLPGAEELLRLLAQYCQIESAGLYAIDRGLLNPNARAHMGTAFELDTKDPLIQFALEKNSLSHVQSIEVEKLTYRYLVAVPLVTRLGRQHGLLVITKMPFFSLHDENLQTLNLLIGYYADSLEVRALSQPIMTKHPKCPTEFAFELARLWRIREESGVKSVIVALSYIIQPGYEDLLLQVKRQARSLDVTWMIEDFSHSILITLMPLASLQGAEGYITRIETWCKRQTNMSLEQCQVTTHIFTIDEIEPISLLERLRIGSNVPEQAWYISA